MGKVKAGIIGAAGYTGGELLRILLHHPQVEIAWAQSNSNGGNEVSLVHQDLMYSDLVFTHEFNFEVDVIFICSGHGKARLFLENNSLPSALKIVDLSRDFRLKAESTFEDRQFVYGLPELNKSTILDSTSIANPGCFATALQLGLLPLAKNQSLDAVYSTGITGSTGAGQSPSSTGHFSWRNNNIQSYKTLNHQHVGEVVQSLAQLQKGYEGVNFIPWRGDFSRGIHISSQFSSILDLDHLYEIYERFYADAPFVKVSRRPIHLKQVVNTNYCAIHIEKQGSQVAVHSAIDNLIKGASGQAVQNMNLIFGLEENSGLGLKAAAF